MRCSPANQAAILQLPAAAWARRVPSIICARSAFSSPTRSTSRKLFCQYLRRRFRYTDGNLTDASPAVYADAGAGGMDTAIGLDARHHRKNLMDIQTTAYDSKATLRLKGRFEFDSPIAEFHAAPPGLYRDQPRTLVVIDFPVSTTSTARRSTCCSVICRRLAAMRKEANSPASRGR